MDKQLRLLLVEDSEADALLLTRLIKRRGYDLYFERVDDPNALRAALKQTEWHIVVSDFRMPRFSGLEALQIVRASGLDLPFIIVSGAIGEETAVEVMRAGAHDYVMKANLARLIPAIERELHEAAERQARNQAERQVHRLSRALEQSASLVLMTDSAGKIEYLNAAFSRVTGYAPEELLGENIDHWQPIATSNHNIPPLSSIVLSGSLWRGEVELSQKNGESYWAALMVSPIRDAHDTVAGSLIVQEDITERKRLEVEIQCYMTQLEQMVEERTVQLAETNEQLSQEIVERTQAQAELTQARDQALEALRFKTHIINTISHETRTPAAVINLEVYSLNKGRHGPLTEAQKESLGRIYQESELLVAFMDNLMDVAHLETTTTPMQPTVFSPSALMDKIVAKLDKVAQAKNLTLNCDLAEGFPETLQGDLDRLYRIGFVLVDNALRFTERGSVSIRIAQPTAHQWTLQVSDTGHGIPPEVQQHIFEPFWQADWGILTRELQRGAGLGLTVAKKLVTLIEGKIEVTSDGHSGTTFTVTLPIEYPQAVAP